VDQDLLLYPRGDGDSRLKVPNLLCVSNDFGLESGEICAYVVAMTPIASIFELRQRVLEIHEQIQALGVVSLSVFGSFARGEQRPDSDVDILVEFRTGAKSFDGFMSLAFLLEDVLGRTVELVTPRSLSRHIGPRILREAEHVPLVA